MLNIFMLWNHDPGEPADARAMLDHLTRNARSDAVRDQFRQLDHTEYTDAHDVRLLVSPGVSI